MKLKNIFIFLGILIADMAIKSFITYSTQQAIAPAVLAAIISAGGGLASGLAGNIGKGKRARKQAQDIQNIANTTLGTLSNYTKEETGDYKGSLNQIQSLSDLFGQQAGKSYLDTTEGKSFQSMIDERSRKNADRLRTDLRLMGGATPEAYLAGLDRINQQEGSSIRDLITGSDQRRNQLRGMQLTSLSQILGGKGNLLQNKTNLANSALNFGTGVYGQSQQRNDSMMNNINKGFQDAAMFAYEGNLGENWGKKKNMKNAGAQAIGLAG